MKKKRRKLFKEEEMFKINKNILQRDQKALILH